MDARAKPWSSDPALKVKAERIARGGKPRVLDLFAGCGGISLGFHSAGFSIDAAVEMDPDAAMSHALNFHGHLTGDVFAAHARARDITATEPEELARELGLGAVAEGIDVLVGGPPCQAYARVGRAKLREIAEHPDAFRVDPRRNLYLRYLAYVRAFRPLALLMENVPDILNQGGHNVIEEIIETLDGMGYEARYSLVNTAFHGVPQMRDRVFMIAVHRDLHATIRFPAATRHMTLPPGYGGTRAVALKFVDLFGGSGYVHPDVGDETLPFAVTAEEAIADLPPIRGDSVKRGARRFGPETLMPYRETNEISAYAAAMRQWPGFEAGEGVIDHAIRYLPRDGHIFAALRPGAEYPEAHALATRLFEEEAARRGICPSAKGYEELRAAMVPPYDPSKFPNRWWKLRADFPVRTLLAHLGKDSYSHIHYDGDQARCISVREAARLQSFPDGFRFHGTMNPAFRQIGNSVPPLMAKALAESIGRSLREATGRVSVPARVMSREA